MGVFGPLGNLIPGLAGAASSTASGLAGAASIEAQAQGQQVVNAAQFAAEGDLQAAEQQQNTNDELIQARAESEKNRHQTVQSVIQES